jgi:predicted nucleic acid-binding protein
VAPDLLDLEVTSVLRRLVAARAVDQRRAGLALQDLGDLPVHRAPARPLLPRIWQLRHTLTVYEAAYVALAETSGSVLLTADARIAGASGPECIVEVLSSPEAGSAGP